jgi:predicted acylesterase/phospholipase RssA
MMSSSPHRPSIAPDAADPPPRRALVLAGGGMRVAYQAGAVKALFDAGLRFDHADGASGGTINLAALMSGQTPDALCDRWRALKVSDFAALRPATEYLHAARMKAFGSAEGMADKVYPALGIAIERIRAAEGIEATFNVCRFDDKTLVALPHRALDMARLVAAASLPIFMPAVQADGQTWTDAVWIKDANLLECVRRGASELWLVWCIGNTPKYHDGAFRQYVHMIEMSAIGALNWELTTIADINARIARGETVMGHDRPITVHIVKPERPLPLDPDFFVGRIDAATLIDMGYRDARRALRRPEPAPLDPEATTMTEPHTGISFRETMAGGFTLGATDPQAGARGSGAGHAQLAMHATIHIADIEAFVADPTHLAELTGHIDFVPMALAMPAERGVFGLFSPSGDPALTYMVYELGFRHQDQDWYLAGKKHVRIGGPWRLWGETTTLYTTLHRGADASAPVAGAGVLSLGVGDLLKLLGTLHATDAPTAGSSAGAVWRFFRFFSSELARSYLWRRPLR